MFRTRFKREILAEFLPPRRQRQQDRVIILCDGMPSVPRKQPLSKWLAQKGYWVFYPRYRGAWESGGELLARSPHEDILDVIDGLSRPITELAFGKKFEVSPAEIFVIGGSFGGAVAILSSLDERVTRVVANCPVVDWAILQDDEQTETSNPSYTGYIREAFGGGYRLSARNWNKLYSGKFFNPAHHADEIDAKKILMYQTKDDPHVPWQSVEKFARQTGVKLRLLARGGHLKTEYVVQKHWKEIERFLRGK